jgi:replicative DNA helicase
VTVASIGVDRRHLEVVEENRRGGVFGDARWVDGKTAMLASTDHVPANWGNDDDVLWAANEPLMLAGPDGIGKTTLGQQLALCRVGIRDRLLGYPVRPAPANVLYIAADRPRQALRSMRRMVVPADHELLEKRLVIWHGPLPQSLSENPKILVEAAEYFDASDVVIDSLKDVVADLTKDETGSRANIAFQELIATDRELLTLHHQRKNQPGGAAPKLLSDVYGSRWLTAGQGSVLMLWGEPGDLVVELRHLKQPAQEIGPLQIVHDHQHGRTTVQESVDLHMLIQIAHPGLDVHAAAVALYGTGTPSANQIEKARRRLEHLCKTGRAERRTSGRKTIYVAAERAA